ncbi:hypothetical protein M8J77_010179 [Diaphorina citri]|nr:hypothetical protein M8J77_010179 [Diaphorina citri]
MDDMRPLLDESEISGPLVSTPLRAKIFVLQPWLRIQGRFKLNLPFPSTPSTCRLPLQLLFWSENIVFVVKVPL